MLWSYVDGAHTFLVSKPSSMSEEEAPASAYLRAVCVAGFVYTEWGKSTKDTVSSIAITAHTHTHNNTYLHVHTHAQMHTHFFGGLWTSGGLPMASQ